MGNPTLVLEPFSKLHLGQWTWCDQHVRVFPFDCGVYHNQLSFDGTPGSSLSLCGAWRAMGLVDDDLL